MPCCLEQASVQVLSAARADLEIRESQYGMTAFLIACENGRVDVVRTLAESGADINAKDHDGSDAKKLAETDKHYVRHSACRCLRLWVPCSTKQCRLLVGCVRVCTGCAEVAADFAARSFRSA